MTPRPVWLLAFCAAAACDASAEGARRGDRPDPREWSRPDVEVIASDGLRSCAIVDGEVTCFDLWRPEWRATQDQPYDRPHRVEGLPPEGPAIGLAMLEEGVCALDRSGALWCVEGHPLGNERCAPATPTRLSSFSHPIRSVIHGDRGLCALLRDGTVECALPAPEASGCLGPARPIMTERGPPLRNVRRLISGAAIDAEGRLYEWGVGTIARVKDEGVRALDVALFWNEERCVIEVGGALRCSLPHSSAPTHASAIWCGPTSCAARVGRDLVRWGWPSVGSVLPSARDIELDPVGVAYTDFGDLGCAITAEARVHCWGRDALERDPEVRWRTMEVDTRGGGP